MTTRHRHAAGFLSFLGLLALTASAQAQINIVINAGSGLSSNQAALAAFNRAANQWASRITDPITVTIDANLANLGSGVLGSTSAVVLASSYDTVRSAMVADSAGQADETIVGFLPTSANFHAALPSNITLSGNLSATKANFKALGFTGLDTQYGASDGAITFSNTFAFDYDNSDGVTVNTTDFETVAAHEIGHLLGFISSVDEVDFYKNNGQTDVLDPTTLDLFRFANGAAPSSAAAFATAERSLLSGSEAVTSDVVSQYRMSTGALTGDGRQASHWKANEINNNITIGIMDPTLATQEVIRVGDADFRAMDLIGYNVVTSVEMPEPSSLALPLLAVAIVKIYRGRKRKK